MAKWCRFLVAVGGSMCLLVPDVFGVGSGGYTNQTAGARAFGQANAFTARANDSSAVTFNPAGLAMLNANEVSLGATFQTPFMNYQSVAGESDHAQRIILTVPNLNLALRPGLNKWAIGLGITSPFGLSTDWRTSSPLRFVATRSDLNLIAINPNFGYQINPDLSVGVGVDYFNSYKIKMDKQLSIGLLNFSISGNPIDLFTTDEGRSRLEGRGDGWGYNFGLLWKPMEKQSLGLTFRSPVKVKYEGDVNLSNLSSSSIPGISMRDIFGGQNYSNNVTSEFTYPAIATLGYAVRAKDNWLWELDVEWTGWSEFQEMKINYSETDLVRSAILNAGNPTPKEWKNVFSAALGTEYVLANKLALRGGYFFWDTPLPTKTFEPSTPDSDVHGLALGLGYPWGNFSVDFGYQFLYFARRTVDNTVGNDVLSTVNGKYKVANNSYALNFSYKF